MTELATVFTSEHHHFIKALPVFDPQPLWQPDEVLIFLHIPKTGGTTLDWVFSCVSIYNEQDYHRFPVMDYMPQVFIVPGWQGAWNTVATAKPGVAQSMHLFAAHAPFGMHELFDRPCRYFSLIRDPVVREISSFNFHYQNLLDKDSDLFDLIQQKQLVDNPQTRMLCGKDYMQGDSSQEYLAIAKHNVEQYYALLGVTERIPDVIQTLVTHNGWSNLVYPDVQVTAVKKITSITDAERECLAEYHALDVQLHAYAQQRFAKQFEQLQTQQQPDLQEQLVQTRPTLVIPTNMPERGEVSVMTTDEADKLISS